MTQARGRIAPSIVQSAVGLTLIAAIGSLIGLVFWIGNVGFGGRSFRAIFLFPNAGGMTVGTRVAYRGVRVGRVVSISPEPQDVAIEVEISPADILIPSNSLIEATQAGLVGETTIDITPLQSLPPGGVEAKPLEENCDPTVIICNGSRIQGQGRLDVNTLIRSLLKISNIIGDPEVTASIRSIAQKTSSALTNISSLSGEATTLLTEAQRTGSVQRLNQALQSLDAASGDVRSFSTEATSLLRDLQASDRLNKVDNTLTSINEAADQISVFLRINQNRLGDTVDSIAQTSNQLRLTISRLDPVLSQVDQSEIVSNLETMSRNLEITSRNAVQLTENFKDVSNNLNDPQTLVLLQQLLESARAVFDNVEKITSDVDQLTGDPQLRQEIIRLIQGLSDLVSSSQHLEQQIQYAQMLNDVSTVIQKQSSPSPQLSPIAPVLIPPKILAPLPANHPISHPHP